MDAFAERRAKFRVLHESGCFVIPNPWDAGSARYLQSLGFKALASTSSGFAFTKALSDEALTRDIVLQHLRELVQATDLPVNADFQAGYGATPGDVAESVRLCVETGVAGLSIEDSTGDAARPLYELPEALDRLAAARSAIDATGQNVMLVARAECYLTGHPAPLDEAIRRLQVYSQAGADVLYAPGPRDPADIQRLVQAVAPKPFNLLIHTNSGVTLSKAAELGVRRISVGSALNRAAWTGFINAAKLIAEEGKFDGFEGLVPFSELNRLFD